MDITQLQFEIDQFLNGEFDVFVSMSGNGIDLHDRYGYVETFDDIEEASYELFKS
jgi:hypothetical protein